MRLSTKIYSHAPVPKPSTIQVHHPPMIVKYFLAPGRISFPMLNAPNIETKNKIEWTYTDFLDEVKHDAVDKIDIFSKDLRGEFQLKNGLEGLVQLIPSDHLIDDLIEHHIEVKYIHEDLTAQNTITAIFEILMQLLGFAIILRVGFFLMNGGNTAGKGPFGMSQSVGKLFDEETEITTSFKDVAGIDNAKDDLKEIVQFLKNGDKFVEIGARIPKGILLVGPPGTGKTLLAKAVAGEADVPFFSCSASEFVELFVGLGASRIRDLFKKAKEKAPCIIFIDEIDAIGKKRSSNPMGNSNDEREQSINQLLTEMDGFNNNDGVIVIAATNRPELLDDALIRPGRFDRQVLVELPDYIGRKEILKVHLKNKRTEPEIDLERVAKITIGFSGADLENLCNEAAIYAAINEKSFITNGDISKVFDKLVLGPESKTRIVSESKQRLIAYHEAGHALMGILLGDYDNIRKISIVPRGNTGGVTYFEPSEERVDQGLYTREYLENQLMVMLSGRIAEEIKFGTMKITTGASQDFREATELAIEMVTEYGFNETIGPLNVSDNRVGDAIADDIASEVKFIIEKSYENAKNLIEENIFYLDAIANALIEKEHLEPIDILKIIEGISCSYDSQTSYYSST